MSILNRKRRMGRENMVQYLFNSQFHGRGITSLRHLPSHLVEDLQERFCEDVRVPRMIQYFDRVTAGPKVDTFRCLDILKEMHSSLTNFQSRRSSEGPPLEAHQVLFAELFVQYGGDDLLVRLISFVTMYSDISNLPQEPEVYLRIKSVSLEVLTKLISVEKVGQALAEKLAQNDELMHYVFTLMVHKKTYMTACQFLEDTLQGRKTPLNINTVPHMKELLMSLDDERLSNFCRVLAITNSDLDIYQNRSSLVLQNEQKRSEGFINMRDINQEFLMSVPNFLERLVRIATQKTCAPRYLGMASELESWMKWIGESMADAAFDVPVTDDFGNFVGGVSVMTSPSGPMHEQPGIRIALDLHKRVQVVYVLGLFLVGKNRKRIQKVLAELGIVPAICEVFEQFIWKHNDRHSNSMHRQQRLRGHNASCECSPEVAVKIQYLRLIHSFCDHSDYKHLLLSKMELLEIRRINMKAGHLSITGLDEVDKSLMCKGNEGLLTKIVEIMKTEAKTSTFRFWLARAVESYLRGTTSYCDQVFLLRRGLLQHVAGNICSQEGRSKEILQSSFDLLGELLKFNIDSFRLLAGWFTDTGHFEKFVSYVNRSLVDSNMFLRSLILSHEHFITVQTCVKQYAEQRDPILMHIGKFEQQMFYLTRLIDILNVSNLTQENVSCLNTSLVFLMFANQKSHLPRFLKDMARIQRQGECKAQGSLMKNFRDLLIFWQDHYLHKDKDCTALEKSSRVPFDYWKETVATLVSDDRNTLTSIIHYMDPEPCPARDN